MTQRLRRVTSVTTDLLAGRHLAGGSPPWPLLVLFYLGFLLCLAAVGLAVLVFVEGMYDQALLPAFLAIGGVLLCSLPQLRHEAEKRRSTGQPQPQQHQ